MIDTANYQIRLAWTKLRQCHLDTIDGRAVARPHLYPFHLPAEPQSQRGGGREGTRIAATGPFWGTDYDVAQLADPLYETVDTFGVVAVVVGDQYQRFLFHYQCLKFGIRALEGIALRDITSLKTFLKPLHALLGGAVVERLGNSVATGFLL